jgi:hypothetical protein
MPGGRPTVVTPEKLAEAWKAYGRGATWVSIARRLRVGRSSLYRALRREDKADA